MTIVDQQTKWVEQYKMKVEIERKDRDSWRKEKDDGHSNPEMENDFWKQNKGAFILKTVLPLKPGQS